jgi:hypothetical protein
MRFIVFFSISLVVCFHARAARACSVAGPTPLQVDPAAKATDTQPPTLTVAALSAVQRGQAPQSSGCGSSTASSCDDLGAIRIAVDGTDDMTMPIELGFRASLVGGTPPTGLSIPEGPVLSAGTFGGNELVFWWIDGSTDDQEAIDFTLSIVAVDHAGNESAPKTVRIFSEGSGGGCAVATRARRPRLVTFPVLALAALAARRRRRDARP